MEQNHYLKIKRSIDIICSLVGLILLSPVYLIICIVIKVTSPGPILFKQKRVGLHKKYFNILKFRTMRIDTPKDMPTHLLSNPDQYITKIGKILRKTSLDELPQIINILKGDMSIIGPRPALWNQYDLLAERDKYGANDVTPGLTGWAQVHGRDELEIEVKAKLDGFYVKHMSFRMDAICFVRTIFSVLKSEGVVEGGIGEMNKKKDKILIITNHSYMLYQFRRELIQKLLEKHEIVISMPFVKKEDEFQKMGCRCIETDVDRRGINPITDFKLLKTYSKIIKNEKPDLVITYSIKPNIYAGILCRLKKIPYVANVQGLGTAFQKKGLAFFVTMLYKFAFGKVKTVFFENEVNAEEFRTKKIISLSKQTVLNGAGVNLEYYPYSEYPQEEDKIRFLFVGRIMKEKGVDELFASMKRLKQEYGEKVILDLIGFFEDEYKAVVEKMEKSNIVVFHGFQEDTRTFYMKAHCVVLPSYHEGMSNVLLEASALGRPVITSDIPGCREAVEDGKTGYLCKVKDTESLYARMKQFVELNYEDKKKMGKDGRTKMENEFAKNMVVEETIKALR